MCSKQNLGKVIPIESDEWKRDSEGLRPHFSPLLLYRSEQQF